MEKTTPKSRPKGVIGGSLAVAAGIFLSRLAGLLRQSVFAYYFGNTAAADVFNAAFRIPNLLQNLFGEGALSASFIPVYARLKAEGKTEEATRTAWAVASIMVFLTTVLVLAGVLATPLLIDLIVPGFTGEKREASIRLVQIFFPGAGLLVISAWCLGVLNSHRAFFLSYAAPVVWSVSIISSLVLFGQSTQGYRLAQWGAWGSVIGSFLQMAIQLPQVIRYLGGVRGGIGGSSAHVGEVFKNFIPVALSRGVVQVSAYVDQIIASFLPTGAVAALSYAQVLYTLPVSLFGMAVSAAELPEMSGETGTGEEVNRKLRERLASALKRMAFFVVPSAAALFLLGDVLAAMLFQRGKFSHNDAVYVWTVLAGSSVGLLAATFGRLYASVFYALRDTKKPFKYAMTRVALSSLTGYLFALHLPALLGQPEKLGTAGLALASGLCGWVEYLLLRRGLERRIGKTGIEKGGLMPLWLSAAAASLLAWGAKLLLLPLTSLVLPKAALIITVFGCAYFAAAHLLGVSQAAEVLKRAGKIILRK